MKKTFALLMALILVFSLVACSKTPAPTPSETPTSTDTQSPAEDNSTTEAPAQDEVELEPYTFALYAALTGDNAQYGQTYKSTVEIYVEKRNAEGGINGHPVVVEYYDDKNDPKESLNIANLIAGRDDILGVVGSQTSTATMTAVPVFQEVGIPMITPQAGQVDVTLTGNYIFRMCTIASFEGNLIARRMIEDGCQNLAVIYSNDDYGVNILETWSGVVEEMGGTVIAAETFVSGQTKDFTPLLSKIKAAGADAIYIEPGYSDAAMIVTQMAQLDCNFKIYGNTMLYKTEFLDAAGGNAEGMLLGSYINPNNTEENFVFIKEAYETATGNLTDMYVLNSYDAIALLCDAVAAVGPDRPAMADWIANVKDWQGASGVINFDENRNPTKDMFWYVIENNEFVLAD